MVQKVASQPILALFYALGFATGNLVGIKVEKFIAMGVKSRVQIIRDIGGDPALVDAQLAADRFDARPIPDAPPQQTQNSNEEAA